MPKQSVVAMPRCDAPIFARFTFASLWPAGNRAQPLSLRCGFSFSSASFSEFYTLGSKTQSATSREPESVAVDNQLIATNTSRYGKPSAAAQPDLCCACRPDTAGVLARLEREDGASVSELAAPFAIKLPAVMKHLDVLDDAGLITRSKTGRTVTVRLAPEPMREAATVSIGSPPMPNAKKPKRESGGDDGSR
jgi:hypothetical protein